MRFQLFQRLKNMQDFSDRRNREQNKENAEFNGEKTWKKNSRLKTVRVMKVLRGKMMKEAIRSLLAIEIGSVRTRKFTFLIKILLG